MPVEVAKFSLQKKIMMLVCGTIVCGLLTYMGGKYMGFWGG